MCIFVENIQDMEEKDMKFYRNNQSELEEVKINNLKHGDLFIGSTGTRYKKIEDGKFVIDKASELVDGEMVEDLTPKQLDLYWKLMKNRL